MKDMKIGLQLRLGLGAILAFVVLLGALTWYEAESLWQETKGLYEHPLQVRRAVGNLTADILAMNLAMKDLCLTADTGEREGFIQWLDTHEADAYRQFDIIRDRYLGPKSDVDEAHNIFVQWKAIRSETVRLLREGMAAEAVKRIRPAGISCSHVEKLMKEIKDISDFSTKRGDLFYRNAQAQKNSLLMQMGTMMAVIFLLSSAISYFLIRSIRKPLKELVAATEGYGQGKLEARCGYASANEFGVLAASFNSLAETVQTELQTREKAGLVVEAMLREEDLHAFCRQSLQTLIEHTGSQLGAVYLLNPEKTAFDHFESIGLSAAGCRSFSAQGLEGEFGPALAAGHLQRVADIPEDTRFAFSTVSGDFKPREILTLPLTLDQEVIAVLSLASVRRYPAEAIRLVDAVSNVLTARLNAKLAFRKIIEFSEKLEHQNHELEEQKRELAAQKDELSEQNIELEMQTRQLGEASRLKSNFLSNMSHELRTPLNSVIALSCVLSRRLKGMIPEEEYSYLEVVERNGRQLLDLINDILDLSRIEAGREEITLGCFSVSAWVGEIVDMMEPQAREKKITLHALVDADLPPLTSDLSKCRHILQNIVGNAVKFTEAGRVEITATRVDDTLCITVKDTGIGIAADKIPFIFEEFRQADESASRKYGGSGLGLAIAGKYATLLNGSISVESTPGMGSTFRVTLPMTLSPPSGAQLTRSSALSTPDRPTEPLPSPAGKGKTLLLVEDSESAVIQMRDILSEHGYRVLVARNGKEALEQIGVTLPDAMILDLMMPEVDGFQVLKTVRGAERTARLPVLILTAKHVTREELKFLTGNHIHQLIRKGDVSGKELLSAVGAMVGPKPECPAPGPRKPARYSPPGKPVILAVEDNPDNMRTVRALLGDTCTLIEAVDGAEGLEQAKTHQPDLVLLDISLPVMDGFEVLDELKKEEGLRHIPVIALTARAMKGDREGILAHGFDGYISKPVDGELLERTIKEMLYGK